MTFSGVFVNMCSGLTQSAAGVFPDKEENPRVPSNIRVLTREEVGPVTDAS